MKSAIFLYCAFATTVVSAIATAETNSETQKHVETSLRIRKYNAGASKTTKKNKKVMPRELVAELEKDDEIFWKRELQVSLYAMSLPPMSPNRYKSIIVMEKTCSGSGITKTFPFDHIVLDWSTNKVLTPGTGASSWARESDLVDYTMTLRDTSSGDEIYKDIILVDSVPQDITDPGNGAPNTPRTLGFSLLRPYTQVPPNPRDNNHPFAMVNQQEFGSGSPPGNQVVGPIYNPSICANCDKVTVRVYENQDVTNLPCDILSITTVPIIE